MRCLCSECKIFIFLIRLRTVYSKRENFKFLLQKILAKNKFYHYLSTNFYKISLLLLKIVKKITIPLIWANPGEKWGKQVT